MRIASIDYGKKRLGLAISDERQIIASPLGVVSAGAHVAQTLSRILEAFKPYALECIIVGYPLHLNGTMSHLAHEVDDFLKTLQAHVGHPVKPFDERLSSVQAERILKESGMRRKKTLSMRRYSFCCHCPSILSRFTTLFLLRLKDLQCNRKGNI